jgi:nucleotide-binding universal stress UspA family protein
MQRLRRPNHGSYRPFPPAHAHSTQLATLDTFAPSALETRRDDRFRLLVGLDHSAPAQGALHFAVTLAQLMDGSIVAVHVANPATPSSFDPPTCVGRAMEAAQARGEHILASAADVAGDRLVARELHFGDAATALCRRARELQVDLVVVGSRGLGRFDRLLMGSVSAAVSAEAPCSVLVVRSSTDQGGPP